MYQGLQDGLAIAPETEKQPVISNLVKPSPVVTPIIAGGGKKKPVVAPMPFDFGAELRKSGNTPMKYDDGDTPVNMAKVVGQKLGVKPSLLLSSAWQEGMNKAALDPESVSTEYIKAKVGGDYPIDGFLNYGVDTIGDKWDKVKKYLPEGFEKNMQFYNAVNEKGEKVKTAAFNYNENALMAKAAMMKYEADNLDEYAKKKGVELDDKAKDYFMLAAYNGGQGNAQKMMDEYILAKDKDKFIENGETKIKGVHKNIKTRLDNMKIADELINSPQQ